MKKRFYLLLFLCFISFISQAQIRQGQVLLGGDLSLSSSKGSEPQGNTYTSKATMISLSPSVGKAIKDNLVIGLDPMYGYNHVRNIDNSGVNDGKTNSYGLGIFLREYKSLGNRFNLFTQERLGGNYWKSSANGSNTGNGYALLLGFSPGISYGITNRVQLEAGLQNLFYMSYGHQTTEPSPGSSTNNFSIGTSLSKTLDNLSVGCRFLLGR